MNHWDDYIGNTRERVERVGHKDLMGLAALMDYDVQASPGEPNSPWPANAVPPFAHWLNGNPHARQSAIGADGHPARGSFLPNIPFPARMWAGSRVQLLQEYAAEQTLLHRETIKDIKHKTGRSGEMVFVTLRHEYYRDGTLVLLEEQDIVYRTAGKTAVPESEVNPEFLDEEKLFASFDFDWCTPVHPGPVLLFRYSAVTFNGHRIHYDREYATKEENYPGLVVHGPLTASLLIDLYQRNNPDRQVKEFEFKALAPLFDTHPFYLMGKKSLSGADLWTVDYRGSRAMQMKLSSQ